VTLRFGLLGTGYWAAETQGAGLDGHPDVEFVGVWGRDPAKTEALAGRYRVRPFADADDLLAAVDAVAVALPPDIQAPLAIRAAQAGRHLLLDKPVALDRETADRLLDAVRRAGVASLVFVTNRYRAEIEAFLGAAVATGGWSGAQVTMLSSIFAPDGPYANSPWRRRWGGLWDVGPHALSILLPVLGPVVEVTAVQGPHDTVHAILRHDSGNHDTGDHDTGDHDGGPVSTMSVSVNAPPAVSIQSTTFFGESGAVSLPVPELPSVDAFRAAVARLAGNVARGVRDDPLDIRSGRDMVAILAAAQASADGGGVPQGVCY
jgi:predicted dehydrogenase